MNFWRDQIKRGAKLRPDEVVFSDTHGRISFAELATFVESFSIELKRLGVTPSDRVLIILPRGVVSAACTSALLASDIPTLAIERANLISSLDATISKLDPRAIIFLDADRDRIPKSTLTQSSEVAVPIAVRDTIRIALRKTAKQIQQPPELGWFLQTSGSTRDPRLVMMSRQNLVTRAKGEVRDFSLNTTDVIVNTLSFTHDVGFNQLLSTLASLSTLRIQNQPFPTALVRMLTQGDQQGVSATPLLWMQAMSVAEKPISNFRYVAVSGGSLSAANLLRLSHLFPGAKIIRTYGQTETFRSLLNQSDDFDSQGSPIADVRLEITPDGELLHFGAGEMMGYFGAPEASNEKMIYPGIRTGDLFSLDSAGTYRYQGRRDDMFKRFDTRMHLGEIEQAIGGVSGVTTVAALTKPAAAGDPRENLLAVFVTLDAGSTSTKIDIAKSCRGLLDPAKQPDVVEILNEMPRTASYKIDRAELRRRWDLLS